MHCRTEKTLDRSYLLLFFEANVLNLNPICPSLLYKLRVQLLDSQGKSYKPVDVALGLTLEAEADIHLGKRSKSLGANLFQAGSLI